MLKGEDRELLWTITSFARVEHNCGRKGGLFNCLRIVETKACIAEAAQPVKVGGNGDTRTYGAAKIRTSKGFLTGDGLSKFYD
jgi:hypothetical protein